MFVKIKKLIFCIKKENNRYVNLTFLYTSFYHIILFSWTFILQCFYLTMSNFDSIITFFNFVLLLHFLLLHVIDFHITSAVITGIWIQTIAGDVYSVTAELFPL